MKLCDLDFDHDTLRSIRHNFLQIQNLNCWDSAETRLKKQKIVLF